MTNVLLGRALARRFLFALGAAGLMLGGCGTPTVMYREANSGDAQKLEDGQAIFRLRTSNLTLSPPAPADSKTPPPSSVDVCPAGTSDPRTCLKTVGVKASAKSVKETRYLVVPADSIPFTKTKLGVSTVDGDDTLMKSVTVSYNDNIKQAISGAAATATALYPLLGPVGAVIGIGAALTLAPSGGGAKGAPPPSTAAERVALLLCKTDQQELEGRPKSDLEVQSLSLTLPVVLTVAADESGCWHFLPQNADPSDAEAKATAGKVGNGWFYQLVYGTAPEDAQAPDAYFKPNGAANSGARHDFPYSPCQEATLNIAWWRDLGVDPSKQKIMVKSYPVQIARPDLIQVRALPKAGSITLGSVCGASVSYTAYTGATPKDDVDALIKAATDLKTAQDNYKKGKK